MGRTKIKAIAPLQSWDIYAEFLLERSKEAAKKADLAHLDMYASKYHWNFDSQSILTENYTTIVLTDSNQRIQWVNPGFTEMTGYPKSFALGQHPRFLQGEETSQAIKSEIRNTLSSRKPVSQQLLNYRKDGTTYICDIKIIPLFNDEQELVHFMALEKVARAS